MLITLNPKSKSGSADGNPKFLPVASRLSPPAIASEHYRSCSFPPIENLTLVEVSKVTYRK
jgi:hypothetical protein